AFASSRYTSPARASGRAPTCTPIWTASWSPRVTCWQRTDEMALSIGLIGLPNVGKSTTFNALTRAQNAQVANYPFCTIEPNRAIVPLPDERLEVLQRLLQVPQAIPATIEFVDIAGLVRGASQG